jgi:hypothetical protein
MEASWARSVYLYVMCAVSVGLVIVGLGTTVAGLVHTVAPDLGHRDTLDRVGIGVSNIAGGVIELVTESQREGIEDFCQDVTDTDDDFDDCVDDELAAAEEGIESVEQGIAEVKDELRTQIRNSGVDAMIRGIVMLALGVLLFAVHGPRTELFAEGVRPKRPTPDPEPQPEPFVPASPYSAPPPSPPPPTQQP